MSVTKIIINDQLKITIRPIAKPDYINMHKWLSDSRVLEFYEGRDKKFTLSAIEKKYDRKLSTENFYPCIIEFNRKPVGYIQYYLLTEKASKEYGLKFEPGIYAIDLFIGKPELWGRGIGSAVIRSVAEFLIKDLAAIHVVIDPRVDNFRSIRAYEKAGFKKVRILTEHEMFEGKKVDCWLMEYYKI